LGYQAGFNEMGDNKLYIENSNSASPLIYGEFDNDLLKFNGTLELANGTSASSLKFYEPSGSGTNYTSFLSQAQAADVTYTLPVADGSNGQMLQTDGSGALSWSSDSGATDINGLSDGKTGGNSVFLGSGAGAVDDESDNNNVGIGIDALNKNTIGDENTAIGSKALYYNTEGYSNTAVGQQALYYNTEGCSNTAMGNYSLQYNTTGLENTALGLCSMDGNTTGNNNVGIGAWVNGWNKEGSNNTIVGYNAGGGYSVQSKSGNVFLGYKAGYNEFGDNKLYIENSNSASPLIYGEFDNDLLKFNGTVELANGTSASSLKFYEPSGSGTNYTSFLSQAQAADVTYTLPAALGTDGQILKTDGSGILSWTNDISGATDINGLSDGKTGGSSVFLGSGAGASNIAGNYNTAVGWGSLFSNTSGSYNTAIGSESLRNNIDGEDNIAIGKKSLYSNTSGGSNNSVGNESLYSNTIGDANTAIGSGSLYNNTTGIENTALGVGSMYGNTTGNYNVGIGSYVNDYNSEGSNNTIVGYEAGCGSGYHNKSGNVFLGYQAGYNEIGDNKLYIENSNSSTPLIYGEFDNDLLKFNGTVELANGTSASSLKFYEPSGSGTNYTSFLSQAQAADVTYTLPAAAGTNGQILKTDGSGILSWTDDNVAPVLGNIDSLKKTIEQMQLLLEKLPIQNKAIQEQQEIIKNLQQQNMELIERIEKLEEN